MRSTEVEASPAEAPSELTETASLEAPAPAPDEATLERVLAGSAVLGGAMLVGMLAAKLANSAEEEELPPPPRWLPSPPIPTTSSLPEDLSIRPVTERPVYITHAWCSRFYYRTRREDRIRIVPSAASRSQYDRIAKVLYPHWGKKLDAHGIKFETLRWIAAPQDFEERQARYHQILNGGRPRDLRKPRKPLVFRDELVLPARRRPQPRSSGRMTCVGAGVAHAHATVAATTIGIDEGADLHEDQNDTVDADRTGDGRACVCAGQVPAPQCGRRGRRRWTPSTSQPCDKGHDVEAARNREIAAAVEELMRQQGIPVRESGLRVAGGDCLPHVAPCPKPKRKRS